MKEKQQFRLSQKQKQKKMRVLLKNSIKHKLKYNNKTRKFNFQIKAYKQKKMNYKKIKNLVN